MPVESTVGPVLCDASDEVIFFVGPVNADGSSIEEVVIF
jgi:hypothetical protein